MLKLLKNSKSSASVSFKQSIFCANPTDVSSFVPVFIIIANNSAFDNDFSPYNSNFSYGLSAIGNSFILMSNRTSFLF